MSGKRLIRIQGANQHNLQNVSVDLPHEALVVITGPSGSGKSSLAFDTLYAEGQRRYVESLSAYARQFLDQMQKPDVEHIDGLSPAIAIEQRSAGGNPRSIVATTTEIYDYLRLLYAHIGIAHCPRCGKPVAAQSPQQICEYLSTRPAGKKMMLLAPYVHGRKGEHRDVLDTIRRDGYVRVRVNDEIRSLDDEIELDRNRKHRIEAVVDRLVSGRMDDSRLNDSVERALRSGEGRMIVLTEDGSAPGGWHEESISEQLACASCNISIGELLPRNFSFNSPYGACPTCHGLGSCNIIDETEAVVPSKSLANGAVPLWKTGPRRLIRYNQRMLECVAKHYGFSLEIPFETLSSEHQRVVLFGSGDESIVFQFRWAGRQIRSEKPFEGILNGLLRRYQETESKLMKERLRKVMVRRPCPECHGARLRAASLAVTVRTVPIHQFLEMSVGTAAEFVDGLSLAGEEALIASEIVREIRSRLGFLKSVGLSYLNLNRESGTLSGGEAQRIRLATQVGSGLVGVLYVLDEPSIGLHQRDNRRLLNTLMSLRDLGNTVVVVEHDLETIERADYIVDLGPGAGYQGGRIVYAGPPQAISGCRDSLTAQFLCGQRAIEVPSKRTESEQSITIVGACANNLKKIDVEIPLGVFCCITGVSGSGKSTLINQILLKGLHAHLNRRSTRFKSHKKIIGLEQIDKMIAVDQSPIGRTPRSNPATYTGAFDIIRSLFAQVKDSKVRGYKPGRFSFNVKGGRCEACKGDGIKKIEMQFLPDVHVPCESCAGKRYNRETLTIRYKGKSIADVLEMTAAEAATFFSAVPRLARTMETLVDVGLGYIRLGQPATTLSGGEAQRVKLSTELARKARGHTMYVLDEPTTGLHIDDIRKLLEVLIQLRDRGNTVLVIEHNLDVIKVSDHIVDLGPEGGEDGGTVVTAGTPEEVAACPYSYTGQFLVDVLAAQASVTASA